MADRAAMMTTKFSTESANGMPTTCMTVTKGLDPDTPRALTRAVILDGA